MLHYTPTVGAGSRQGLDRPSLGRLVVAYCDQVEDACCLQPRGERGRAATAAAVNALHVAASRRQVRSAALVQVVDEVEQVFLVQELHFDSHAADQEIDAASSSHEAGIIERFLRLDAVSDIEQ